MFATLRPGKPGRLEILFPSRPCDEVRGALKARGYRWLAREGLWYGPVDALPAEILADCGVTLGRAGDSDVAERQDAPPCVQDEADAIVAEQLAEEQPSRPVFRDAWRERQRRDTLAETCRALLANAVDGAPLAPAAEPAPVLVSTLAPAAAPPRFVRTTIAPRTSGGFFDTLKSASAR